MGGLTEEGELDTALMEMLVDAVGAEKIVDAQSFRSEQ